MKKRFLTTLMAGVMSVSLLSGCGGSEESESSVLRVAMMPEVGGSLVQYAVDNGYFEDAGLEIETQMFSTGATINEALAAGEVDIGVSGMASLFSLANGETTWIGETNSGSSGLGIYVRKDNPAVNVSGAFADDPDILGDASTAKGMEILGPVSTSQQYHVVAYANAIGLKSDEISMINMEQGPALTAFESGQGDGISASPPNSFALEDEGYVKISDFDVVNGTSVPDGVIVNTEYMEANRDQCVEFLKVLYRVAEEFNADTQKRFDFSMSFFNDNGKDYTDAILNKMIEVRPCWDKAYMSEDDYVFGEGLYSMIEYYKADGKITEDQVPAIGQAFDDTLLEDALGIELACVSAK